MRCCWMLMLMIGLTGGTVSPATAEDSKMPGPLDFKLTDIDGKEFDLAQLKGKVVLIVNVASECGYTPQYEGLQELYKKYEKAGLVVVGIPSNDFGRQEPGTNEEIKKFCTTRYKVTFPMMAKAVVRGEGQLPLYKVLVEATPDEKGRVQQVAWNFEKFLIGRDGRVVGRFKSAVAPESEELLKAIRRELEKPASPQK